MSKKNSTQKFWQRTCVLFLSASPIKVRAKIDVTGNTGNIDANKSAKPNE